MCVNSSEIRYCDQSYPTYIQIMYIYILSPLIGFGVLGNLISLTIFLIQLRRKEGRSLTLLIALAVADSLYLLSSIFSRLLPTISKYIYIGQYLEWSIYIRPYATAMASILQAFASYMVLSVTLQRYILIKKPLQSGAWLSMRKMIILILGPLLLSIGFNIPRFFELHVEEKCNECLGVNLPTQRRTKLGENLYFNIVYTIILRTILKGVIPVVGVTVLTYKLILVMFYSNNSFHNELILFRKIIYKMTIL